MRWYIIFSFLSFATTATLGSISLSGCNDTCGRVTIPYPFGIGPKCSANSSFTIECMNSTTPILSSIKMEVVNISISGILEVKQRASPMNCSNQLSSGNLLTALEGTPFSISARHNSLIVLGCKNSVWLPDSGTSTEGGCSAVCGAYSTEDHCNGVNCCQITIPRRFKEIYYTYQTTEATNNSFCGYIFPADKESLKKDYIIYHGLLSNQSNKFLEFAPLVLEWEYGELKGYTDPICGYANDYCLTDPDESGNRFKHSYNSGPCLSKNFNDLCQMYPTDDTCRSLSGSSQSNLSENYFDAYLNYYNGYDGYNDYVSTAKYCSCPPYYEGNPYLPGGCLDIDECSLSPNPCEQPSTCINLKGDYVCRDTNRKHKAWVKIALISIGSVIGALILLLAAWILSKFIRKRIKANRRCGFFKRNGGLLLEQQLSATDNGLEKTKLYSSKELSQATDHYNENRVLGCGGQGTVYKGMLTDGRMVAIKKSKKLEEGNLQIFINEVVILSQVNHRNVVKLLGCCLETEVPLLVYEFIPNGTLFQHIHEPADDFRLTWSMRVRIAKQVAGALAYLHSAASAPIYHRDIKSTNILLDKEYQAKISDFGTSRSVLINQTHVTTQVVGTFGYLDPEYFRSSQFTEKSDVYSYGVVLVELLTGEKAVSAARVEEEMGLAMHFLHSMEATQLWEIVDARVLREGKGEHIEAMAEIARKCLHLKGKSRPKMKEVARQLDEIQLEKEGTEWSGGCSSIEYDDSDNFSELDVPCLGTEHDCII